MPTPPGPVSVSRRTCPSSRLRASSSTFAPDERHLTRRQPGGGIDATAQRREVRPEAGDLELEEPFRLRETLQAVRAQIAQRPAGWQVVPQQSTDRVREHGLLSPADRRDPGRATDLDATVVVGRAVCRAGMQADAEPERETFGPRMGRHRRLHLDGGARRVSDRREDDEEGVTLGPDDMSSVPGDRVPDQRAMRLVELVIPGPERARENPWSPRYRCAGRSIVPVGNTADEPCAPVRAPDLGFPTAVGDPAP